MPINLKEIFVSDTNQIKIDKINYNFDQIIGTGGQLGPRGPQGVQGNVGPVGPQGVQGPEGVAGANGVDGNDGQDRWYSVQHAAVTGESATDYDTTIIKPKIDPSTSGTQPTSVYIGDPDFNNLNLEDGDTEARSSLVVGKKDPFENHIRLIAEDGFDMVIRGDQLLNYGGIFHIQRGLAFNTTKVKGNISFDDVTINATNDDAGEGIIELSANKTEVISTEDGFYTSLGTKSYFNDRVHVVDADLLVQGGGFTRISKGTSAERDAISSGDLSGGNLRYNSQTNQYEAYYQNTDEGDIWLNLRQLTDADGDTYIDLPINGGDADRIIFYSSNQNFLRIGGTQFSLQSESAAGSTTVPTIVVNETVFARERVHFIETGKGISFKEGPAATNTASPSGGSAVNYNTSISQRTLDDYFVRDVGPFELEDDKYITPNEVQDSYFPGPSTSSDTSAIITDTIFSILDNNNNRKGLLTCINGNTKIAYQKIGKLVNVQVDLVWKPIITSHDNSLDGGATYSGVYESNTNIEAYYWDDASVDDYFRFQIPELYKRLDPAIKIIAPFTHANLNIDITTSNPILESQGSNNREYFFKQNASTGFGGALKTSDIVDGHFNFGNFGDAGNWIYTNFSLTYPCDKTSMQSNFPFNDGSSGGGTGFNDFSGGGTGNGRD